MTPTRTQTAGLGTIDAVYALLAFVAVLPGLVVRYPENVDYLNHLARLFVLSAPVGDPVHHLYRVAWHAMPNLAFDLLGIGLVQFMPVEAAAKGVWGLAIMGLAAAAWFLNRALHGRSQPPILLAAVCLVCFPVTAGFIGFVLGLAAALAGVGLWFRMGARVTPWTLLVLNLAGAVVLVMHEAAFGALAFTVAVIHVLRPPWTVEGLLKRAAAIAGGFVLPILLFLTMEHTDPIQPPLPLVSRIAYDWIGKLRLLPRIVFAGHGWANAAGAVAVVMGLYAVLRPPGGRCDRRMAPVLIAWVVLLIVMPADIGRATAIDMRLIVFPAMLLFASLSAANMTPSRRRILIAVIVGAVVLRAAILLPAWRDYNRVVQDFRGIEGGIPAGARVLVANMDDPHGTDCGGPDRWEMFYDHIPTLLLTDRAAFVPTIFSAPGMQPIRVADAYRAIMDPDAPVAPFWALLLSDSPEGRAALAEQSRASGWRIYYLNWRQDYEYLALLDFGCRVQAPDDKGLTPIAESPEFRLYRIVHDRAPPAR